MAGGRAGVSPRAFWASVLPSFFFGAGGRAASSAPPSQSRPLSLPLLPAGWPGGRGREERPARPLAASAGPGRGSSLPLCRRRPAEGWGGGKRKSDGAGRGSGGGTGGGGGARASRGGRAGAARAVGASSRPSSAPSPHRGGARCCACAGGEAGRGCGGGGGRRVPHPTHGGGKTRGGTHTGGGAGGVSCRPTGTVPGGAPSPLRGGDGAIAGGAASAQAQRGRGESGAGAGAGSCIAGPGRHGSQLSCGVRCRRVAVWYPTGAVGWRGPAQAGRDVTLGVVQFCPVCFFFCRSNPTFSLLSPPFPKVVLA